MTPSCRFPAYSRVGMRMRLRVSKSNLPPAASFSIKEGNSLLANSGGGSAPAFTASKSFLISSSSRLIFAIPYLQHIDYVDNNIS
jgi:hypothetical protein